MEKIKLVADTASDIPDEDLERYGIDMPSVPITVDGEGYYERRSFGITEFYDVLVNAKEVPATSRVPTEDYLDCYRRAFKEGYTDVISVTINAAGSGTNASSQMAAQLFYSEVPEAKDKMNIHVVDSRTYCLAYGYPVILAAQMIREGKTTQEILNFFDDFFSRVEIYLGCYTLEFVKRSGRVSAAAGFVGEVLGLRPIITIIDGETKVVDKVRGDKLLIPRLVQHWRDAHDTTEHTVAVCGMDREAGLTLQKALTGECGHPVPLYHAGASIAINAGPRIAAFVCLGKRRPQPVQQ